MRYDAQLFQERLNGDLGSVFRSYIWQQPGMTYPEKRPFEGPFLGFDHASRSTGGGLVFHSPGDLVLSCIYPCQKGERGWVKRVIEGVSVGIDGCLADLGVVLEPTLEPDLVLKDINFCLSYPNPYERRFKSHKVVAIAARRSRDWLMLQAVIHLQASATFFSLLPMRFQSYFTQGINVDLDPLALQERLSLYVKRGAFSF
ncbi:MAG: hypothetical protein CL521_06005 [Actinobacteria bacterium]|nr:hypothetical protein [Actinomycetota bacterium]